MKIIKYAMASLVFSLQAITVSATSASEFNDNALDDAMGIVVTPRIVGGQSAPTGAWPSVAALVRSNGQSLFLRQFCAANQISERWVVTAAHCVFDAFGLVMEPSTVHVAVGFSDLANESDATELVVTNIIAHPDYEIGNPSSPHDLALIELAQLSSQPSMKLYSGNANQAVGENAVVIGWGATDYSNPNQPSFPSKLNQVTVPFVDPAICNGPQSYGGIIGEGQVCAGLPQGGRDSCVGDSGGPLMSLQGGVYRQVGVVSFGRGCAEPDFYGVYTRLAHYETWISEITSVGISPLWPTDNENPDLTPITPSSTANKETAAASIGPFLPFFMMFLALLVLRRNIRDSREEDSV